MNASGRSEEGSPVSSSSSLPDPPIAPTGGATFPPPQLQMQTEAPQQDNPTHTLQTQAPAGHIATCTEPNNNILMNCPPTVPAVADSASSSPSNSQVLPTNTTPYPVDDQQQTQPANTNISQTSRAGNAVTVVPPNAGNDQPGSPSTRARDNSIFSASFSHAPSMSSNIFGRHGSIALHGSTGVHNAQAVLSTVETRKLYKDDKTKRGRRLEWLTENGTREDLLAELVLFSSHVDSLWAQLLKHAASTEGVYNRNMTAGRRECGKCETCKKYVPGVCAQCGCPPLAHNKVLYEEYQREVAQFESGQKANTI